MPIRGLDLVKQQLNFTWIKKGNVSVLKDSIIAIDGFWFLKKYVDTGNMADFYITSSNDKFVSPVLKFIKMISKLNIQLLFVWDGLEFKKPHATNKKGEYELLENGYHFYSKNDLKQANQNWRQLIDFEDAISLINNLLKQFGHDAVRAPYSATAQIAYFLQNKLCDYAFSKNDTLIFDGVEKIISDFHMEDKNILMFTIFNKKDFMKAYDMNYKNFKILAFALGCEFCPTIPEYADNFIFENVITIVKTMDFEVYLEEKAKKDNSYKEYNNQFYIAHVLIDYHPVMKEEGRVSFYNSTFDTVPSHFEDLFGKRLPDKFYNAIFNGRNFIKILDKISKNALKENDIFLMSFNKDIKNLCNSDQIRYTDKNKENKIQVKFFSCLNKSIQILIYYLINENILKENFISKLLCLLNIQDNLLIIQKLKDFNFDYADLNFVYKCNKVVRRLRETKEFYDYYIPKNEYKDVNFNFEASLFTLLYYKNICNDKEDNGIKYINEYLKKLREYFKLNLHVNDRYKQMSDELTDFLK